MKIIVALDRIRTDNYRSKTSYALPLCHKSILRKTVIRKIFFIPLPPTLKKSSKKERTLELKIPKFSPFLRGLGGGGGIKKNIHMQKHLKFLGNRQARLKNFCHVKLYRKDCNLLFQYQVNWHPLEKKLDLTKTTFNLAWGGIFSTKFYPKKFLLLIFGRKIPPPQPN